jgi:hypothetical protein
LLASLLIPKTIAGGFDLLAEKRGVDGATSKFARDVFKEVVGRKLTSLEQADFSRKPADRVEGCANMVWRPFCIGDSYAPCSAKLAVQIGIKDYYRYVRCN